MRRLTINEQTRTLDVQTRPARPIISCLSKLRLFEIRRNLADKCYKDDWPSLQFDIFETQFQLFTSSVINSMQSKYRS